MTTFIIIDELGQRHATIKAETRAKAFEVYFKDAPWLESFYLFAIDKDQVINFKTNINKGL